ncbi:DUF4097 family beta strand repeat-containing protein [Dyadobacter frigoris]|uniref:DUF4097 domain-containing protein n=1 Tax=Dyadobacter frigoris TaxID=2576211 RepID=A0A4U6D4T0_9BACT|nr:DUF4097 domain-containing protein [Dyadobacter frigoris]TKT91696.1 DUF4097 domain-containing protein [Dyadobacter frigoris]GLU51738.1 hypothetical protein Dfri01_11990 [Dyadobacter frigoris]
MKKINLLLAAFVLFITISANAQNSDEKPYISKNFTSASLTNLKVETSGGSITVAGDQPNGVKVEMYVRPNNWNGKVNLSKEEIEDKLEDFDIFIGTEGSVLKATAVRKNRNGWDKNSVSISFKISTPRNMATNLRTSGGSIRISSLTGEQNFRTSGGSLKVSDLDGLIDGQTSGGSIEVENCKKEITLSTSGGSIKASELSGKINLHTSGGSITLNGLDGSIVAQTSGGSIKGDGIKGDLDAGTSGGSVRLAAVSGSVKAHTSGGSMEVEITQIGKFVDLSTSAGSLRVNMPMDKGMDLNLKGNKVTVSLKNFDGQVEKDRVLGKMNGGGIPVNLSANGGSVSINQ